MLHVSTDTVYNLIKRGELEALKVGSQYVITRTHLLRYVDGDEDVLQDLLDSLHDDADDESPTP